MAHPIRTIPELVDDAARAHEARTWLIADDGSFTLRGLPTGNFTLVFTQGGVTLGTATFTEVKPNQEITVTIEVTPSG